MRHTKILATIGPSSSSENMIAELIKAGANAFRLNFSHGTHAEHTKNYNLIRKVAKQLKVPIAILLDLQGPKIRIGKFLKGKIELHKGFRFILTTRAISGDENIVSVNYSSLPKDVRIGEAIYLNDGIIRLRVMAVKDRDIITTVEVGGTLSDHKGINLPGTKVSAPCLTPKDRDDLQLGLKLGVDFIALSFVRSAPDILALRKLIAKTKSKTMVVAKIEKPEAVANINSIIEVADGIMIARGDLGVELSPEEVPAIQKQIIKLSRQKHRFVITATQMLESMISNSFPTRAEASDVANAIYDGSDALMLSAETAAGQYPIESVEMMARIAMAAEKAVRNGSINYSSNTDRISHELALADAAVNACDKISGKAIIVFSKSGNIARLAAYQRKESPIIALSPEQATVNQLCLVWGIRSHWIPPVRQLDKLIKSGIAHVLRNRFLTKGDTAVMLVGRAFNAGSSRTLQIVTV